MRRVARHEAGKDRKWCKHTHEMMKELGLEKAWQKGTLTAEEARGWDAQSREAIHKHEEQQWKQRMTDKPTTTNVPCTENETEF